MFLPLVWKRVESPFWLLGLLGVQGTNLVLMKFRSKLKKTVQRKNESNCGSVALSPDKTYSNNFRDVSFTTGALHITYQQIAAYK